MANARQWVIRVVWMTLLGIPALAIGLYFINPFGVQSSGPRERIVGFAPYRMPSISMEPSIRAGQIVINSAGYYTRHTPQRGDVVLFTSPREPDGSGWVKRIVGLPGETIEIRDGRAVIDGAPLDEPYIAPLEESTFLPGRDAPAMVIPQGHYYLLGDNRDHSDDSRYWGTIPRSALRGRFLAQ